ncbi:hypothetical protein BC827DRAFT_1191516 [Russula dissimulans]|nr:hypothetical protein BC827DRAFT_1191516 [Russula dissimulans]
MKITIKTLQQKVFHVEADPSDTVSVLKERIQADQGHPVTSQKIIYSGKVLSDDKTIESCNIKEKDFLVLMVSKPKPIPAASTSTSTISPVNAPPPPKAEEPTPAPVTPVPAATSAIPASAAVPAVPPTPTPEAPPTEAQPSEAPALGSSFLSGDVLQTTIRNMEEMGFPRDQVLRALRASYNNPDRAVEYLFNGIPAHLEAETAPAPAPRAPVNQPAPVPLPAPAPASTPAAAPAPPQPSTPQNLFQLAQQQQQQHQHPTGAPGLGTAPAGPGLDALISDPRFNAIRELASQNPALLQPVIQQLAQNNPQFAQVLQSNPEALLNLLGGEEGGHVVEVTPEEHAAIQRLEALGFPRQAAIEAYFACGKNEELAANFLFEGGFDDDDPQQP